MTEYLFDLQMFTNAAGVNVTTDATETTSSARGNDLSPTMKEFYDTQLLENARADLYFNQFGKKQPLPKNNGDTVEWRRWETFEKATTPLTEGITPTGNKLSMVKTSKQIKQYGDYSLISDRLELEAIDNVILGATEEHGAQAGETIDAITRDELMTGTSVAYAGSATSRASITATDTLTASDVNRAVTFLKKNKTPKIDGSYVCIIHPSVSEDLRESTGWIDVVKYQDAERIFNGEIGKLHGCRFVETTEAPVLKEGTIATYACIFFGKDAWGVIEPSAESMQMIIKQRGSAGTSDPLDQKSSVGWKCSHAAKILYQERMIRVECGSSYSSIDDAN